MKMALKIWRYNPVAGERALKEYEIDAPEEATLLDCLDIVKDRVDGTLAYRKSCRMMICGSCGMRMDGAAVLACKTRMYEVAEAGHVPVISAMGNLPIVKDLVVDMEPFWGKIRAVTSSISAPKRRCWPTVPRSRVQTSMRTTSLSVRWASRSSLRKIP